MSFIRPPSQLSLHLPTHLPICPSIHHPSIHPLTQQIFTKGLDACTGAAETEAREAPVPSRSGHLERGDSHIQPPPHPGCHPYFPDGKAEIQGLQRKKTSCLLGTITRKQEGRCQHAPSRGELGSDPGLPHLPRASALGPLALGARRVGGQRWRREALGMLTVLGDHCSIYRARQG